MRRAHPNSTFNAISSVAYARVVQKCGLEYCSSFKLEYISSPAERRSETHSDGGRADEGDLGDTTPSGGWRTSAENSPQRPSSVASEFASPLGTRSSSSGKFASPASTRYGSLPDY